MYEQQQQERSTMGLCGRHAISSYEMQWDFWKVMQCVKKKGGWLKSNCIDTEAWTSAINGMICNASPLSSLCLSLYFYESCTADAVLSDDLEKKNDADLLWIFARKYVNGMKLERMSYGMFFFFFIAMFALNDDLHWIFEWISHVIIEIALNGTDKSIALK